MADEVTRFTRGLVRLLDGAPGSLEPLAKALAARGHEVERLPLGADGTPPTGGADVLVVDGASLRAKPGTGGPSHPGLGGTAGQPALIVLDAAGSETDWPEGAEVLETCAPSSGLDWVVARVESQITVARLTRRIQETGAALAEAHAQLAVRGASEAPVGAASDPQRRFLDLVNSTDGIVWEADAVTFGFTFVSNQAERLLGFPVAAWLEPGFWVARLHPADQSWAPAFCADRTTALEPHEFEYRFIANDGRTVWLRDIVSVVSEGGVARWLRGLMIDVTRQKALEAELQSAYQLVRDVQRLAKLGGWTYDCATARVQWTDEVYTIHGLGKDFDPSNATRNMAFYAPADVPKLTAAFWRAVEFGQPYDLELQLVRRDGVTVWVRMVGNPELVDGEVARLTGSLVDISERKAREEEINSLAFFDPVTQLPNRRLLMDRLQMALATSSRTGQLGAVIFLDLDRFKEVNDAYGHDQGDVLLCQVAARLAAAVRSMDTVARFGGDEFVVLLTDLGVTPAAATDVGVVISQKILASLRGAFRVAGHVCECTASIGVTIFNGKDATPADVLRHADAAMYDAKARGRNGFQIYIPPPP